MNRPNLIEEFDCVLPGRNYLGMEATRYVLLSNLVRLTTGDERAAAKRKLDQLLESRPSLAGRVA